MTLSQLISLQGHSIYILASYGLVIMLLLIQWFIPWRRLKKYE